MIVKPTFRAFTVFGAIAGAALLLVSCQTTTTEGQRQAEALSSKVSAYRQSMAQGRKEFETTLAAHEKLVTAKEGNLQSLYANFTSGLHSLDARRETLRGQRDELKQAAQAYYANWQTEAGKITNEAMRQNSMNRMQAAQQSFDGVLKAVEKGVAAYEPIMNELKDHAQFLSVELNFEAANSLQKDQEKIKAASADVYAGADAVIAAADKYLKEAAAKSEPPKPPATTTTEEKPKS